MSDHITITGTIATDLRHIVTTEGMAITSFRFASPNRVYDRKAGKWVDQSTNWFTVTAFRALAINTVASIRKGDHLIVSGRLRLRDWASGERAGTTVEIEAEAIGHDLAWGTSQFTRHRAETVVEVEDVEGDVAQPVTPEAVAA